MNTMRLTLTDHTALTLLAARESAYTNEIARACGLCVGRRCRPQVRNMLRRLERWGYATRSETRPGCYTYWTITQAGRKAVHP